MPTQERRRDMASILASKHHEAYCLECCGGGKTLVIGSKQQAAREATSHIKLYGHKVTLLYRGR
jgi:hypothetical protein